MSRKKLIRLAIFIIGVIVVLIVVENSIRGIGNLVEERKEQKEYEEKRKQYESSEEYKEEQMLVGVVADFSELLKNKDIDTLYDLIDENYKDYKFQNQKEIFAKYIEKYLKDDVELSLQTYEMLNGKYYCSILSTDSEGISSFVALIDPNEDNSSYTVIFDNISNIEKINKKYINSMNIECNVIYKVTAEKTCIYTAEFTNLNESDINYTIERISLINTKGNGFSATTDDTNIILKSGEKTRKNLVFYASGIHSFPVTRLIVDLKDTNGQVQTMDIYMDSSM